MIKRKVFGFIIGLATGIFISVVSFNNRLKQMPVIRYIYKEKNILYNMTGTGYYPEIMHTDRSPLITACGFKINRKNPIKSRFVGLPMWMIKSYNKNAPFKYGDTILVNCTDSLFPYKGKWIVADCTNKRNYNIIDFCIGRKDSINLFKNLTIEKYEKN